MRIVFVGAGELTVETAEILEQREHEIVIIEENRDRIDELAEELDCSFLHGNGTKPDILREAGADHTDFLFCLSESDQTNILACLVGRSLGFERVIPRIHDPQFAVICRELGLEDFILPSRTIARYLADITSGLDILELSTAIKGEARLFAWTVGEEGAGPVTHLDLPSDSKVVCYYRDDEFHLADEKTHLSEKDQVVVLTHSRNLPELKERWTNENSV